MTADAQKLFAVLRPMLLGLSSGVIEMPELKSIAYHAADGDFFAEVLPRKQGVVLLLNLEFSECDHLDEKLKDATEQTFIINAMNTGGATYRVQSADDITRALRYVRQAHELAAS